MAEHTNISWCDSTFNAWMGCTKISPGCDHCYAEVNTAVRFHGVRWGNDAARHKTAESTWKHPLAWNRKAKALGRRWLVFTNSLADVFDNAVPVEWRGDLGRLIRATPNLTWLLLTKRIGNAQKMMARWSPDDNPLPNVWLGASVVNQEEADRDIWKLLATPAAKRFVSYEPALGPIDFTRIQAPHIRNFNALKRLDWIIFGGESNQGGARARPVDLNWARMVRDHCEAEAIAFFMKQIGDNWLDDLRVGTMVRAKYSRGGANPAEWPEDLRIQDFPA